MYVKGASPFGFIQVNKIFIQLENQGIEHQYLEIGFGLPITDFGSIWSSQKSHEYQHIQRTTKTRVLCFDPQSLTKLNYYCSVHVFYAIDKAASIYSIIYFGYSAIAGSFGGQVSFESTDPQTRDLF